jgi:predicted Zn-dependent peptidase
MYYGSTKLINTEIKKYRAVTREDIMNVAKKYLTVENSVVLYYLPKK